MPDCLICFEKCNQRFDGPCICHYYVHNTCFEKWIDVHSRCIICGIHIIPTSTDKVVYRRREIHLSYIHVIVRVIAWIVFLYIIYDSINTLYICLVTF